MICLKTDQQYNKSLLEMNNLTALPLFIAKLTSYSLNKKVQCFEWSDDDDKNNKNNL